MNDFRNNLYRGYVATFKQFETRRDAAAEASARRFFDFKYLPHLRHVQPDDPILEVGCGPGQLLAYLAECGFRRAEGIDLSAEQVALARERGVQAQCADVFDSLDKRAGGWAAIVAIDFIEHFTKEECLRLLTAFHRALCPGGVLLLQTPNGQGLFAAQIIYGDLTHCTIFTPGSLTQALRHCGFDEIAFDETGPVPKNFKGRVRLLLWNIIKSVANIIRLIEAGKRQGFWTENLICACRKPRGA